MNYLHPEKMQVPKQLDISHEELVFCLEKMFPGTAHGRHYMVLHPVAHGSAERIGPATIAAWNIDGAPIPDLDVDILPIWQQHQDECKAQHKARDKRGERHALLLEADVLVNRAHDSDNVAALATAKAYRQALRDVPTLPGWPHEFDWPTKPE